MALTLSDGSVAEAQRILDLNENDFCGILKLSSGLENVTPDVVKNAFNDIKKILITRHSIGIESIGKAKTRLEKAANSMVTQQQIDSIRARNRKGTFDTETEVQEFRSLSKYTVELERRMKAQLLANQTSQFTMEAF